MIRAKPILLCLTLVTGLNAQDWDLTLEDGTAYSYVVFQGMSDESVQVTHSSGAVVLKIDQISQLKYYPTRREAIVPKSLIIGTMAGVATSYFIWSVVYGSVVFKDLGPGIVGAIPGGIFGLIYGMVRHSSNQEPSIHYCLENHNAENRISLFKTIIDRREIPEVDIYMCDQP